MNGDLPVGWAHATIGDVADGMKNGLYKPASFYADNGVACLRMYNVDAGKIIWKNIKRMKLTRQELEEFQLLPGDLLVNRVNSRELVGKTAIIPGDIEPCVFESKNIRLRLRRDLVCPEFVNYTLLLSGSRHFIHNAQQVVGMASISQPQVAAFDLPLPPLAEQRRIVAKLEKILIQLDSCQKRLSNIPALLKRFRQSILAAACSGRLTADWRETNQSLSARNGGEPKLGQRFENRDDLPELPETWRWVIFGSVIAELRNGVSPRPNVTPPGVPILRISATRPGKVDLADVRYMPKGDTLLTLYGLRDGDLLFTRYNGSIELLGVCGIVRGLDGRSLLYPDKLMRLRFDHDWISPNYVEIFFSTPGVHERVVAKSKSSAGQNGISGSDIKAQPFALPPLSEQREIARRVKSLFALADRIEARFEEGRKRVDSITQAILAKAFRGELVPTEFELAKAEERSFESAGELLKRIAQNGEPRTKKLKEAKHKKGGGVV